MEWVAVASLAAFILAGVAVMLAFCEAVITGQISEDPIMAVVSNLVDVNAAAKAIRDAVESGSIVAFFYLSIGIYALCMVFRRVLKWVPFFGAVAVTVMMFWVGQTAGPWGLMVCSGLLILSWKLRLYMTHRQRSE